MSDDGLRLIKSGSSGFQSRTDADRAGFPYTELRPNGLMTFRGMTEGGAEVVRLRSRILDDDVHVQRDYVANAGFRVLTPLAPRRP
jgi:hypothetical protein